MTGVCQTDFTAFTTADLPQVGDVFASGAFGYCCNTAHFHTDMIHKLYHCAKTAFAFNMLDKQHFMRHELLTGHDRSQTQMFCNTLSMHVGLVSGYLGDDFTVFGHKLMKGA